MKRTITIIALSLLLIACQSTSPKITVNEPSKEQQLDSNIAFLQAEIASGKNERRYDLALMYSASFDQNTRKLAKPILADLVAEDNIDAIVLFAQLEFLGKLGSTSDRLFNKYYQSIKDNSPSVVKDYDYEKAEMENTVALNFLAIKKLYDENHHLCEQPLDQSINQLKNDANTYLVVKYFNRCLEDYSINNSRQRLSVISKFQEINCSTKEDEKVCISQGYSELSSGLDSAERSFVVAAALRNIYKSHKDLLRNKSGVQKRSPSLKTAKVVTKAFEAYNEKNIDKSCQILINYMHNETKLSAFDTAYMQQFLAKALLLKDTNTDTRLAIEYANKALKSDELSFKEHWGLFDLLSDVYLNNEEYAKYIDMIGNYILENQGDMDLIPASSLSEANDHKSIKSKS